MTGEASLASEPGPTIEASPGAPEGLPTGMGPSGRAGAAAALSCGSELARQEDLKRLVGAALSGEEVDDFGGRRD